jgi:rubrerythrin
MTTDEIKDAFYQAYTGEAKALLRLKIYAEKADQEGYPQIAKLFRVISAAEEIHGKRSLRALKEVGNTEKNLAASFESETKIAGVAYEKFVRLAAEAGDTAAQTIFNQSRDVEDAHAKLYKEAMTHIMEDRQTTYYICEVCGYISDGLLPDQCPVCGAPKTQIRQFD